MTLFDPPAAVGREVLSSTRRRTIRNRELLDRGIHPITRLPLRGTGICGECAHEDTVLPGNRRFHKCDLNESRGSATDLRVSWPACTAFTPKKKEVGE